DCAEENQHCRANIGDHQRLHLIETDIEPWICIAQIRVLAAILAVEHAYFSLPLIDRNVASNSCDGDEISYPVTDLFSGDVVGLKSSGRPDVDAAAEWGELEVERHDADDGGVNRVQGDRSPEHARV